MTLTTQHKKLSQQIFELLQIQSFSKNEIDKIMEWRKLYTDDEIMEALNKAIQYKAKKPLSDYTTKILEENHQKKKNEPVLPKYYRRDKERQEMIRQGILVEEEEETEPADPEAIEALIKKIEMRERRYKEDLR